VRNCLPPKPSTVFFSFAKPFFLHVTTDRLSGVMDDRGKFIYISTEEMKAVAEYIRKQGRVSISHLANNSNQFIDLEPKAQYEVESQQDDSAEAGTEA
jgi:DDRGK domain-containing protein 1